eukprot:gene20447-31481_t
MQALVALAYAAVGWNGRWALGGEGLSCKEVCSSLGDVFSCTEAVWPTVQPDFFTDASLDITENTPLYCDRVIPGGFTDAPVVLGNGSICVWSAPQNTGNNGQYRPGDGRCTRIASLRARRVCPCGSSLSEDDDTVEIEVGGVAGWGHKAVSWIGKDQPFTLRAGVKNVLVTSTVVADEYFYTRTDGVTRRLQAQHSTVAAGPPAPETDSFRAEVMILVSNDLVTVAVLSDATLRAWSSGTVEHLPYRSHSTVEEELYYYSGSPWYTDGWLTPPSFGADIPEAIRAMVLAKGASFVRTVVATRSAFAMLCANGWLVAWGDRRSGGALPDAHAVTVEFEAVASSNEPDLATPTSAPRTFQLLVLEDVDHVSATRSAFCVVFANGTLTSWGSRTHGGTPPHTPLSIAPLARTIPDQPPDVGQRYIRALSTEAAFAALTVDFTVDAWGLQETGGSPLPEITFGTTKVFPDATIVQQCGPGTRVVDTEKECMSLAGRLAKATFEVVANDSHPGGCTYQEWPERLVVKWNPCVYCPACPGTTFPHLIAEFPRLTQSASVPVASAVVCHNLCCAADECRAAVFWNSAFCMFMTEQVLSPADPATRNVSVDTFVKGVGFELNSRPLCMDNSSTSDSGVLKRSEVVGLFASPFSFLAVDSTGNAALWPHRASIEQSPGLQRAFNNASGRFVNAFGSVSGFVLAFVDPGVVAFHTLFSSGNTERELTTDDARAFASNGSANEADPLLQKCKAFCSSVFACTAVQYVPSEAACFFFGDASAVEPSPPLDDDDEEENSTNMTTTTPNKEVDPNDYGSDSFCFAQRDLKKKSLYRYSHLTLTSGPWSVTREFDDAAAETDGVVEIKRTRMRPSEFAITTGSDDPIFDPIQWLIQAVMPPNEAGHRASITILQKTTSGKYVSVPANSTMEYGQNVSVAASKAPGTVLATNGTALLTSVDVMATTVHTLLASKRSFTGVGTYQAQVLPPGESVSAEVAVRSSQFQPTSLTTLNSVFSWGSVIVGGASRQLPVIGEAAYLNVGTFKVLAGGESFVAVRYAPSGHSECALNPCQQSRKVEAVFRHSDQAETLDERQVCIEWNDSAASPSSFACYCTGRPGSAMGGGATCPKEPYLPVWPFLLILLPLCGANFWTCYLSWLRNRVRDQEVACLSDMYSLNASDQEECALQAMLAANDGYEVALLQTLVPHFGARSLETRCFLLWQRRLARIGAADTDLRVLPRDLLRPIQHFVLGLETLQKTRTQP